MDKISIVILTKNEEKNIKDCLESVKFAHEIIIVDDFSDDRTLEVIKSLNQKNIKLFKRNLDSDFSTQRNFGLSKVTSDWTFFIDADERVSEKLQKEISGLNLEGFNAFFLKRRDIMWSKELRYGETGNIKLIRLAKKTSGKWVGKVHEVWDIKEKIGILKNPIRHYPHPTVAEFLREISFYSTLRAEELYKKKVQISVWDIIMYPKAKFILNYFIKLGFMDGLQGLVMAFMMSLHSFLVRSKLWLLVNRT